MIPGEIILINSDSNGCWNSGESAKLIRLIETIGKYELWEVEFEDCPGKIYPRLIKSNQ
jgi:hypothetical protein